MSLALDELVTNVILHGYTDSAAHEIEVALSRVGGDVIVEMEDDAPAFDPSEGGVIDLSGDPEERQIGGLGLHFVRRAIDEMIYRRIDGRNRLLMKKRVAAKRE